jgi:putative transcriptional regulator
MKVKRTRNYRSDAFAAVHETMEALHRAGAISKVTMREFDEACLETVKDINLNPA